MCMCIYVYIQREREIHMYIYVYIYDVYLCVCIYIYIYTPHHPPSPESAVGTTPWESGDGYGVNRHRALSIIFK